MHTHFFSCTSQFSHYRRCTLSVSLPSRLVHFDRRFNNFSGNNTVRKIKDHWRTCLLLITAPSLSPGRIMNSSCILANKKRKEETGGKKIAARAEIVHSHRNKSVGNVFSIPFPEQISTFYNGTSAPPPRPFSCPYPPPLHNSPLSRRLFQAKERKSSEMKYNFLLGTNYFINHGTSKLLSFFLSLSLPRCPFLLGSRVFRPSPARLDLSQPFQLYDN